MLLEVLERLEKIIYLLRTETSSPKCKATTTAWLDTLHSQAVVFNGGDNSEGREGEDRVETTKVIINAVTCSVPDPCIS